VDGPARRKLFPRAQDFFHHDVDGTGLPGQAGQVLGRVVKPVDVVDPQPGNLALPHQLQYHGVAGVHHGLVLGPQPDQPVDVEEPPVVQLLGRDFPEGEAKELVGEQPVQTGEAFWPAFHAVVGPESLVDVPPQERAGFDGAPKPVPFVGESGPGGSASLLGRLLQRGQQVEKAEDLLPVRSGSLQEACGLVPENQRVALAPEGKAGLEIMNGQAPVLVAELDLAVLERLAVEPAQERGQDAAPEVLVRVVPVDVEIPEILRIPAQLQNVPEHRVFVVVGHVVGHDVLHPAQPGGLDILQKAFEILRRPELGVDGVGVDHVVAVEAAFSGPEDGRGVDRRDAQGVEIGDQSFGPAEAERRAELEPVR
jgi:hypothetical protein